MSTRTRQESRTTTRQGKRGGCGVVGDAQEHYRRGGGFWYKETGRERGGGKHERASIIMALRLQLRER